LERGERERLLAKYAAEGLEADILRCLRGAGQANYLKLHRLLGGPNRATLSKKLKALEGDGLIERAKDPRHSQRQFFRLTEKGLELASLLKIKREAGWLGLEWAGAMLEKGYRVRFMDELTGLRNHQGKLFAWHPDTGDVQIAQVFGVRVYPPDHIWGQYVDRERDPEKPIRHSHLLDFLRANVRDWRDEGELGEALRRFYDPQVHNSFIALLAPDPDISMGFPEIGNFGAMTFVGLGWQKHFPFIPKMTLAVGGFHLTENLLVSLEYTVDLLALYSLSWLVAKKCIDPGSIDGVQLDAWISHLLANGVQLQPPRVICKNGDGQVCKKLGRCPGPQNCPILLDDLSEVKCES
jgi:DNA-binding HxlR family transcriptional regulator